MRSEVVIGATAGGGLRQSVREAALRASTLEEGLRAAVALICARTGWQAARIQFAPEAGDLASRTVWHLETPDQLATLRQLAEARRNGRGGQLAESVFRDGRRAVSLQGVPGAAATFAFPAVLRKRTLAAFEFFAGPVAEAPPAEALDEIGFACEGLGELIENKPAEDAVRRAERDYRDLFESAGEALLVLDAGARVVLDANPRACDLCGWPWPELVGADVGGLWSQWRPPPIDGTARFEAMARRRDGTEVRIEVTSSPVRWRRQRATLAMVREVPERERVLEALRASADRDRQLFEKSPQPMWVNEASTLQLLAVNDAAVRAYGYPREELLRMRVSDLLDAGPTDAPAAPQQLLPFEPAWAASAQRHRTAKGELRDVEVSSHEIVYEGRRARLVAVTDVTRRRLAQARLLHQAFYDALTGLPNRALFKERLEVAHARARRATGPRFAVLFLDLDRFKLVNDSLGHEAGDELLVQIARRLEHARRKADTVARLGGDEFTVLVEDVRDEREAIRVAERLHRALAAPFDVRGHEVFARMSIGIALGGPTVEEPEQLLRHADTAMYRAKTSGVQHAVYDRSMQQRALASLKLENELRHAAGRGELRVLFQPVVDLPSGKLRGVEALVRWQHGERGLLSPAEFLPMAEETGLILALGRWVLEEACAQAMVLPEPLTLSVNLSPHQLVQPDLAEQIRGALQRSGFPARRLLLELTESALIESGPTGSARLAELRALGGRVCLDDFGTGYSSLSYLSELPIDALKIDASFIRALPGDPRKIAIVRSILLLGKGLGIDVVAEGVETQDQAALLGQLGCEHAQGFLYSRPVPIGDIH